MAQNSPGRRLSRSSTRRCRRWQRNREPSPAAGFGCFLVQVERLRLVGFKSFVNGTELAIEHGLTAIVGPNGCGKSNLVEALRWVMGENSARRLRGGEMDDVIFAGTTARPARNIAEVALTIDNSSRDAPFAFND